MLIPSPKISDSGLLLRNDESGCVKMHDVVRDTAKSITSSRKEQRFLADAGSGREEWPRPTLEDGFESYTAVLVMFNNIERLPDELVCPQLKTLLLQENSNLMQIPIGFFNKLNNFKVLDIKGLQIESLPPSIVLLQNLCTLYMDRCKSKDISIFGGLKKLEILSLRKSRIGSIPKELAELSELRMLDMTSCLHIETISPQIISRLQVLEELYLHGSFCQWGGRVEGISDERNASLEEVINLPRLTILKVDIEDVNCLPLNVNSTPNWKKFDICISRSYFNRQVNEHLSKLNRVPTRTLFIDATMNKLPDWFFEAVTKKAEMLIYSSCDDLIEILKMYNRGWLFGLKALHVEQCHNIGCLIPLPEGFPNQPVFENLQELHIHHMESMKEICVGELLPGSFERLKFLKVHQCRSLENSLLQSNMIQRLHNLEMLNVTGNNNELFGFEGLQEGPHHLRSLKELRLNNLSKLVSIWKGPAQPAYFSNVKTVIVINCSKLKYVFSLTMSQGLSQLEELWVEDCSDLEEIIQEDGGITMYKIILPQLKVFTLEYLEHLVNFCDVNSSLECPLLEHLHVRHSPKFRRPEFHSSKQVQFDNERHYNILKKRYVPIIFFLNCNHAVALHSKIYNISSKLVSLSKFNKLPNFYPLFSHSFVARGFGRII